MTNHTPVIYLPQNPALTNRARVPIARHRPPRLVAIFVSGSEVDMTTATLIPIRLRADLNATLARLRIARTVGDEDEIRASEQWLNILLERLPKGQP